MGVTPQKVFLSLGEAQRRMLLERCGISPADRELDTYPEVLNTKRRRAFEHDLNCIATLGTDHAVQLVHDALVQSGWTHEHLKTSRSTRDRACILLCHYPDAFEHAFAIWNGNRLRGGLDREQGFKLPEIGAYKFDPLNEAESASLKARIASAVADEYPGRTVSGVKVFERTAWGLPTRSDTVVQCDISFGEDPESIEVIEEGEETTITLTRLSRISIIIDTGAGTIFVGTTLRKKALHSALAQCVTEFLFDLEAPLERLKPLRVFPEKCRSPLAFSFSTQDHIARPRISELRYRLFQAPNTLMFRVRDDDRGGDIHALEDVRRHAKRMRVWSAVIDFEFQTGGDGNVIRRSAILTEPSSMSFGRAFPAERLIMEKVLTNSGLIDPNFCWDTRASFSKIARLVTPHHVAELRRSWLPTTVSSLEDAGIIRQGEPHARAWCDDCLETHEITKQEYEAQIRDVVQCPVSRFVLGPDQVDTRVLSLEGLLEWLHHNAVDTKEPPVPLNGAGRAWHLGPAKKPKSTKAFDLILAIDVDMPETTSLLNDFLSRRHLGERGLVLTLTDDPIQKVFPADWRVAPLSSVCQVTKDGLKFKSNWAAQQLTGKRPPSSQTSEEEWDQILAVFDALFPGNDILQPYPVASELIHAEPELCNMTARTLVNQLRARRPHRFESGPD